MTDTTSYKLTHAEKRAMRAYIKDVGDFGLGMANCIELAKNAFIAGMLYGASHEYAEKKRKHNAQAREYHYD